MFSSEYFTDTPTTLDELRENCVRWNQRLLANQPKWRVADRFGDLGERLMTPEINAYLSALSDAYRRHIINVPEDELRAHLTYEAVLDLLDAHPEIIPYSYLAGELEGYGYCYGVNVGQQLGGVCLELLNEDKRDSWAQLRSYLGLTREEAP